MLRGFYNPNLFFVASKLPFTSDESRDFMVAMVTDLVVVEVRELNYLVV